MNKCSTSRRRYSALLCAAIVIGVITPRPAIAPPKKATPQARTRGAKASADRSPRPARVVRTASGSKRVPPKHPTGAHPLPPAKVLGYQPKAARHLHRHQYWHPRYTTPPAKTTWHRLGYPYYPGGTSYVVVPSESESTIQIEMSAGLPSTVAQSAGDESMTDTADEAGVDTLDAYVQMQELVALIHEWRSLNESPALHERLSASETADPDSAAIARIQNLNQRLDQTTRAAMRRLASGEPAERELEAAWRSLEKLMESAEALPPSPIEG